MRGEVATRPTLIIVCGGGSERVIATPLKEAPPLSITWSKPSEKIRAALTQCYSALEYCDKHNKCD